jgi:hypothetical protein
MAGVLHGSFRWSIHLEHTIISVDQVCLNLHVRCPCSLGKERQGHKGHTTHRALDSQLVFLSTVSSFSLLLSLILYIHITLSFINWLSFYEDCFNLIKTVEQRRQMRISYTIPFLQLQAEVAVCRGSPCVRPVNKAPAAKVVNVL